MKLLSRAPTGAGTIEIPLDEAGRLQDIRFTPGSRHGIPDGAVDTARGGVADWVKTPKKGKPKTIIGVNGPPGDVIPVDAAPNIADGRYDGGNQRLVMELRVDQSESGVISGDLFGTDHGRRDYLASFRSAPGLNLADADGTPVNAIFEDREGHVSQGELMLEALGIDHQVMLTLYVDGPVPGLPMRTAFTLVADWSSQALRALGIELEQETSTEAPPTYSYGERTMSIRSCFEDAGFDVTDAGQPSRIPKEDEGWGNTQLHALMFDWAQSDLSAMAWRQQLLWLGHPTRRGLLGIMFDTTALLPRQGTAVFEQEIRDRVPLETERKIIQTAVHEIGHGLNLAHRFEREVGHGNSTSFMNYDWRYRGGNREQEFWDKFEFCFDPDELEFLRHAPRNAVIPGGAPFHSVPYWSDGEGGYSPYLPEQPLDTMRLDIAPPIGGAVISFGQPVFLGLTLTNTSGAPMDIDPRMLDPKGSFLQIAVRRLTGGGAPPAPAMHFHPIMERCFDIGPDTMEIVPEGGSISDNVQLTFGSGGFTFAEPGRYEVQAFMSQFDLFSQRELIVASNRLTLTIAHPQSLQEEIDVANILLRDDVGVYFALGGSRALSDAEDGLKELEERRMHKANSVEDPIVANIVRCRGIDAGRRYRRYSSGRFRATNGDSTEAAKQLARLDKEALTAFDPQTAAATVSLCNKHQGPSS